MKKIDKIFICIVGYLGLEWFLSIITPPVLFLQIVSEVFNIITWITFYKKIKADS